MLGSQDGLLESAVFLQLVGLMSRQPKSIGVVVDRSKTSDDGDITSIIYATSDTALAMDGQCFWAVLNSAAVQASSCFYVILVHYCFW